MMRLFKTTYKDSKGTKREAAKWYIEFRDHNETSRRIPAFTSKAASEEFGRNVVKLVAYHKATGGQTDPALVRWLTELPQRTRQKLVSIGLLDAERVAVSKPLEDHLQDFSAALRAKGCSSKHVELVTGRTRRVIKGCKFRFHSDISASKVMAYLDELNVKTDRRHDRRALTVDELRRLLDAAHEGPELYGMTGPERAMLYRLAVETGLRAGELRSLTRASFDLDDDAPSVKVAAAYSKRRREDTLPLRPELAEALRAFMATLAPAVPAFKVPQSYDTADMLRADLEEAGITYRDGAGQVVDFHSLRHTFISNLAAGGVHPKTAQALARHSTITLTMDRYTHSYRGEQSAALEVLPDLSESSRQEARATGTDDAQAGSGNLADYLAQSQRRVEILVGADRQTRDVSLAAKSPTDIVESADFLAKSEQPPIGLEPKTCGLQNRRVIL